MNRLLAAFFLALLGCPAALHPQELAARRSPDWDPNARHGRFDLRLRVDGAVDVFIQGDRIRYQVLSGRPPRDAGSEYTQPIPARVRFRSFTLEKKDGRGSMTLREPPSAANSYTAYIHISDPSGGEGRYHARLEWEAEGPAQRPEWPGRDRPGPPERRWPPPPPPASAMLPGTPLFSSDNDPDRYNNSREGWLEFRARVDEVAVLRVRGDRIYAEVLRGRPLRSERFRFSQPLPATTLRDIRIEPVQGRGEVELVEQPWQGNDFTAVIRITDEDGGAADYRFRLVWRR